ncbi:DUF4360 domain-containing protein [Streptomyces xinghaiensis]|uniref:DUF4360 domain-containing protein n=1 Tax=Streptomyces xinghaiensis TaxID=1038928 RepID=UPI000305813B|nr:DUF4360 domain-containing protein [Streptomyces xinghaiensis]MZE77938.1 DUF4360 domain-containing protein [Streptomyces sp. SID5475]
MSGVLAAGGAAAALFASVLAGQSAPAEAAVPAEQAQVGIITVNGSGCPAGTAAVAVSPDNSSVIVSYSDYLARTGAGADAADQRKNCQLALDVRVPSGWTYTITGAEHRGYTHLEKGATGLQQSQYYFQGSSETAVNSRSFAGPYDGEWRISENTPAAEQVWAPCGAKRLLNINTELRVDAGSSGANAANIMAMESTKVPGATYKLKWKRC